MQNGYAPTTACPTLLTWSALAAAGGSASRAVQKCAHDREARGIGLERGGRDEHGRDDRVDLRASQANCSCVRVQRRQTAHPGVTSPTLSSPATFTEGDLVSAAEPQALG